jgi:hypothetical protein
MVAEPAVLPITTPPLVTLAFEILLLLHTPPAADAVRIIALPAHTSEGPVIAAAVGFTVTICVVKQVPAVSVTVYVIVAVPPVTAPVTTPAGSTVAAPDAVHVPPLTVDVSVIVAPPHTTMVGGPEIIPGSQAARLVSDRLVSKIHPKKVNNNLICFIFLINRYLSVVVTYLHNCPSAGKQ